MDSEKKKINQKAYSKAVMERNIRYFVSTVKKTPDHFQMLKTVAKENHFPLAFLCLDYGVSAILFGESLERYVEVERFRYNLIEKGHYYSLRRMVHMNKMASKEATREEWLSIEDKDRFVKAYHDFLGREVCIVYEHTDEEIVAFVKKHHKVVAKPCNSFGGKGLFILKEDKISPKVIQDLREKNYLLEEYIIQHPEMDELNPDSVNTLRVITVLDSEGKMHIEEVYLRIAVPEASAVCPDVGEIDYLVDNESGVILTPGYPTEESGYFIKHPGTDKIMLGYQIPNYDKVIEMLEKATHVIPHMRHIGWDIAITRDGAVLIEGNNVPDMWEGMEPKYYETKGYIKGKRKK